MNEWMNERGRGFRKTPRRRHHRRRSFFIHAKARDDLSDSYAFQL